VGLGRRLPVQDGRWRAGWPDGKNQETRRGLGIAAGWIGRRRPTAGAPTFGALLVGLATRRLTACESDGESRPERPVIAFTRAGRVGRPTVYMGPFFLFDVEALSKLLANPSKRKKKS
jgi:hypothetical protein